MKVQVAPDFRDLFRPLTEEEFEQAKASNRDDPNHERVPPVVVWDGTIVDGHHTHKIRENMRVDGKPAKIRYHKMDFPDRDSAMAYAVRAQVARRNLTSSQMAIAIAKLPKTSPDRSPTGKFAGRSKPAENSQNTREELATEAGIGTRTLGHADKVNEHGAKALQKAVASGDVSVSDAASVVDLPKKEQSEALKKVKQGKAKTLRNARSSGKPPKQFPRSHWRKQWERSIGPLVRLVDKIASEVGESKTSSHQSVQKHLNAATDKMHEWMGKK